MDSDLIRVDAWEGREERRHEPRMLDQSHAINHTGESHLQTLANYKLGFCESYYTFLYYQ